jgi:DNA-binding transcriptional ArsR family regulator
MRVGTQTRLFGTERRTEVLIAIRLLEETYARELARVLGAPLLSVQRIVDALEGEGILAIRSSGRERRITLNPRYFALSELRALLLRLSTATPQIVKAVESLRLSPRKKGKAL